MSKLSELRAAILADGVIDESEVAALKNELYADGQVDRDEVELLIGLRNDAKKTCASFEPFFFEALSKAVLADGTLDADEAAWLRQMLFADGKIDAAEKKFLQGLKASAKSCSPEFLALYDECMKG